MEKPFVKIGTRIINANMITDICFSPDFKICNVYMSNDNHALEFDVDDGILLLDWMVDNRLITRLRE